MCNQQELLDTRSHRADSTTFYVATRKWAFGPTRLVAWPVGTPSGRWYQHPLETSAEFIGRVRRDIGRGDFPAPD